MGDCEVSTNELVFIYKQAVISYLQGKYNEEYIYLQGRKKEKQHIRLRVLEGVALAGLEE